MIILNAKLDKYAKGEQQKYVNSPSLQWVAVMSSSTRKLAD